MTALINYHIATDQNDVLATLTAHTCPNDGYVYAWVDPVYNLLVWELGACPVDAVVASLQTNIGNFVNSHWNYTDTIADPHQRILSIISQSRADAVNWLNLHTTPDIAGYVAGQTTQLQGYILSAMNTQGITVSQ